MTISVGIDIGGTFTDVVAMNTASSELLHSKVYSTPPELAQGFIQAVDKVLGMAEASHPDVARIAHGTTVGTNAILEANGATIGILVTEGFEDTLTIGRQKRSEMYDVFMDAETPVFLTPRRRIFGIRERLYPDGTVDVQMNEGQVAEVVDALVNNHGVEAIAICYLFSFANAAHEERTREIILAGHPEVRVTLSSELDPRFREYERLCLTAFDAYLRPVMEQYLGRIRAELTSQGSGARFHVMHSRGGTTGDESILRNTVSTVLSGPAAGVVGSAYLGNLCDLGDLISLDMGGTSCDIALVEKGKPLQTSEGKIGRYPLRQPMLDINTIGAGGGSIAWLDSSGALRVGPASAGAIPGPACYGNGGTQPTVTDASLALGYLNPDNYAGGSMTLSHSLAEDAIRTTVADPLGMDVPTAAQGIHTIVNSSMADEIRLVSVFRGHDPRGFSLLAMGGAGPAHAGRLAQQSNIRRAIVPPSPGVLSAFGLLVSDLEHEMSRTYRAEAVTADVADIHSTFVELEKSCRERMEQDQMGGAEIISRRSVEMRYIGQSYELEVPFPSGSVDTGALSEAVNAFHDLHERIYGHRDSNELVELITLRITLSQTPPHMWTPTETTLGDSDPLPAQSGVRPAHFTETGGYVDTPIFARKAMTPGMIIAGPAIVEQDDTTTVVYPGTQASVDRFGNIIMELPA